MGNDLVRVIDDPLVDDHSIPQRQQDIEKAKFSLGRPVMGTG